MAVTLALLAALGGWGCRRADPQPPETLPEPVDSGSTTTGSTTSSTTTGTPDPGPPMAPSVSIHGTHRMSLAYLGIGAVPAHGGDPGVLFVYYASGADQFAGLGYPGSFVIPGDLPPGEHDIFDVWDGVSGYEGSLSHTAFHVAGDVNGDGHLDVWVGDALHLGPFLGRRIQRWDDAVAYVEDVREAAVAANFDANGDGHLDVLFKNITGAQSYIRYGPFSGVLPSVGEGGADPATYTQFGDGATAWTLTWRRPCCGTTWGRVGTRCRSAPTGGTTAASTAGSGT